MCLHGLHHLYFQLLSNEEYSRLFFCKVLEFALFVILCFTVVLSNTLQNHSQPRRSCGHEVQWSKSAQ